MYAIHPLTVHFPIALLLANGLLTWLYLRRGTASLETSAFHCLLLGWLGVAAALLSGLWDAARQLPLGDALPWVNAHAASGIALLLLYGQALLLRRRNPQILAASSSERRGYLARLAVGCLLVLASGWLGGHLVYTLRLGVG